MPELVESADEGEVPKHYCTETDTDSEFEVRLAFNIEQANAAYDGGFHPEHPTMIHFWEVVNLFVVTIVVRLPSRSSLGLD